MAKINSHQRINDILLGPLERPALQWLAQQMPAWMTPDILTGIGIAGAAVTFVSYCLTNLSLHFFWLASLGLVINWFGDSLDGTLARYRHIERPRYGFFVDHTIDALSEMLIVLGLGLSPLVRFDVACLALIGYLLMSVLVYVRTYVDGVFQISYGKIGPTEVRVILVLLNLLPFFVGSWQIMIAGMPFSLLDLLVSGVALALLLVFLVSVTQKARELAQLERAL
ncbi:MAG: CDP-alcohol phosphatidyltransferase family protein [Chloroflexota bacterium]|nr:CDP-alcohol phosphatidyltransferase family protein [Anaerolineales bacterium]